MKDLKPQFYEIYNSHYSNVMRLCLGYVKGNPELAKDLAQEVFVRVWQNLESFREESKLATWIYRIAVNTCLLQLRKRKFKKIQLNNEILEAQEEHIDHEQKERSMKQLYQCIDRLSEVNKSIVMLELEGLPQKEIAAIVGCSHAAIRTRLHRIKIELTNCVNNERL